MTYCMATQAADWCRRATHMRMQAALPADSACTSQQSLVVWLLGERSIFGMLFITAYHAVVVV